MTKRPRQQIKTVGKGTVVGHRGCLTARGKVKEGWEKRNAVIEAIYYM